MTGTEIAVRARRVARASELKLSLLNAFAVQYRDESVPVPVSAQRLIAFLAIHEHPVRRLYVSGMLWTDFSENRALANLRSVLWRLQQPGLRIVRTTGQLLRLEPGIEVDVREFTDLAHRLLRGTARPADLAIRPAMLSGELLPDWYDDWVLVERERLRQLSLHALESLSARLTAQGRYGQAIEAGVAAVASEPLRESAHRAVIKAHLAEGNTCEAVRQYRRCRDLLRSELGVAPSPQLAKLVHGLTH